GRVPETLPGRVRCRCRCRCKRFRESSGTGKRTEDYVFGRNSAAHPTPHHPNPHRRMARPLPQTTPSRVIGHVAKEIKTLLNDGIHPDDIRRGLAHWMTKGLHPSTLPSVVNEVMNTPNGSNVVAFPDARPLT